MKKQKEKYSYCRAVCVCGLHMLQCYLPALVSYDFSDCCIAGLGELVNRILVVIVQASHLIAVGVAGALMWMGAGILKATAAAAVVTFLMTAGAAGVVVALVGSAYCIIAYYEG